MTRGFSLMELVVALTINAVVLTAAVSLFEGISSQSSAARQRAELERDATFVQELLERELRLAGLGVPRGANVDTDAVLDAVLVATPTSIGVLADIPRPDAQYPTFGLLSSQLSMEGLHPIDTHLWWFTENNGPCQPDGVEGTLPSCTTSTTSTFFPGLRGCDTTGHATDRVCPWGLRRMLGGEPFQVVYGDGAWTTSAMKTPIELHGGGAHPHDLMFVEVATPLGNWDVDGTDGLAGLGTMPRANVGTGFVVTLDRIFYELQGSTITRRQCWGTPAPERAEWPAAGASAVPANPAYASSAATSVCTPREVIARHVTALRFTYIDDNGVVFDGVDRSRIARISYVLQLSTGASINPVRHEVEGSILLRNHRSPT